MNSGPESGAALDRLEPQHIQRLALAATRDTEGHAQNPQARQHHRVGLRLGNRGNGARRRRR